jgi:hypothetical protein
MNDIQQLHKNFSKKALEICEKSSLIKHGKSVPINISFSSPEKSFVPKIVITSLADNIPASLPL